MTSANRIPTARIVDNLVIGGGPAGAMVALRLASAGRDVVLLEKESGLHHKVCGEFLSPEAIDYLRQAGINPLDLGATSVRTRAGNPGRCSTPGPAARAGAAPPAPAGGWWL